MYLENSIFFFKNWFTLQFGLGNKVIRHHSYRSAEKECQPVNVNSYSRSVQYLPIYLTQIWLLTLSQYRLYRFLLIFAILTDLEKVVMQHTNRSALVAAFYRKPKDTSHWTFLLYRIWTEDAGKQTSDKLTSARVLSFHSCFPWIK